MKSVVVATMAVICANALAVDVSVADFGGVGDGRADCTEAFARAVAAASGGGAVIVPAGEWLTGPIHFRSGVELRIGKGAVVSFKAEPAAYLPAVKTTWGGVECMNYSPLVYAYGCTNVSITGEGALSPKMEVWRTWCCRPPKHKAAMMRLYEWCCGAAPVEERRLSDLPESNMRPQLVHFNRCAGVRVEGIEIRDSPCWSVHFFMCRDVVMRKVSSRGTAWNTDGVDVEASRTNIQSLWDFWATYLGTATFCDRAEFRYTIVIKLYEAATGDVKFSKRFEHEGRRVVFNLIPVFTASSLSNELVNVPDAQTYASWYCEAMDEVAEFSAK